jgi:serine protease Do
MPFQGQVYVLDAMTNNPGAAGGALTNMRGELLGMLGKELRNSRNNTWLNFALPAQELAPAVAAIESGQAPAEASATNKKAANPLTAGDLGVVLLPNVLERTPPFVDTVRPNTPAAKAGLHPDDLVLFVNNQLVQSCKDFNMEFERLDRDEAVKLVVMRNGQLTEVTLKPGE